MFQNISSLNRKIDVLREWDIWYIYVFNDLYSPNNLISELDNYISDVILSYRDKEEHLELLKSWDTKQSLVDYSKDFLKKVTIQSWDYPYANAWELWEIFLWVFQKEILWAIKLVSKMRHRDSIRFNVLGRDTTYVYKDNNDNVCMLIWEAKMYVNHKERWIIKQNSLKNWLKDAHDDLALFHKDKDYLEHEINLAKSSVKDEMNEENKDIYIKYFIKDNPKHSELVLKNVIFVWYSLLDYKDYIDWTIDYNLFLEKVMSNIDDTFSSSMITSRLQNEDKENIYFLLPLNCVEELRKEFVECNNLKDD